LVLGAAVPREEPLRISVECYSGHRGESSPRAFAIGARRVLVQEELDRWLDPGHRYFKVRGDDGHVYILRHDAASGDWEMTLFSAGGGRGPRLSST
jgi:hypothetical protein